MEAFWVVRSQDQIVRVGQNADFLAVQVEASRAAGDGSDERFHGQVEDYGAKWASLFHATADGDGVCLSVRGTDGGGAVLVEVPEDLEHKLPSTWPASLRILSICMSLHACLADSYNVYIPLSKGSLYS